MDTFKKLFGSLVSFVYHCFDRIVILGHLPLLTAPKTSSTSSVTFIRSARSRKRSCASGPTTTLGGLIPSPAITGFRSNGRRRACAGRTTFCLASGRWNDPNGSAEQPTFFPSSDGDSQWAIYPARVRPKAIARYPVRWRTIPSESRMFPTESQGQTRSCVIASWPPPPNVQRSAALAHAENLKQ